MMWRITLSRSQRPGAGRGLTRWCRASMIAGLVCGFFVAVVIGPGSTPVFAVKPDEVLEDATLEKRARKISLGLRCVVCQNQSIDDSDAPLARDLRLLVRERLQAGDSNTEVLDYVVARYGEFVLLKPPFGAHTLFLWLAPLFVLLGAIWLARRTMAQRAPAAADAGGRLSAQEEARLKALLGDEERNDDGAGRQV